MLPGIEYLAGWYAADAGIPRTMPHAVWATLSPEAQHACRFVKAEEGAVVPGAGVLHPLASKRFDAFVEMVRNPVYREAVKHRQAAVLDSRLIRMAPADAGTGFGKSG